MKLIQIKEFNDITVTQKIAGEICSVLIWNHFNEDKYIGRFKIENSTPKGVCKGGSVHPWSDRYAAEGYVKTATGVLITSPFDNSQIRIFEDGKATPEYLKVSSDVYETLVRNIEKGTERVENRTAITHGSQVKLIQCYIDNGFYTIE